MARTRSQAARLPSCGKLSKGAVLVATALSLVMALLVGATQAHAASGTVYSCAVHPVYQHPATGAIEDSGGAAAAATGQAMVESCMSSQGMMEVTDAGECYLTVRLSLMDLTSGHAFRVQDWGAAGWSTPALGVTGVGADANGTTNDVCIGLPSQRGIVRVSMFVDSMGRDVVFYAYADSLAPGAPAGFTPTIVTEASAAPAVSASAQAQQGSQEASAPPSASAQAGAEAAGAGIEVGSAEAVAESAEDLVKGSTAPSAQGLSLSTAPEAGAVSDGDVPDGGDGREMQTTSVVQVAAAVLVVGIVLMLAAACIVYVFRRNWNRWGGADPDDYSEAYRDE